MHQYYYGVQTALSYMVNHYCYQAVHFTYLAPEFYTYRRRNPRSSNPHRIYEDIYEPWKDRDEYSKFLNQLRVNIRNGVVFKKSSGVISATLARRLARICDEIDVGVFYPLVYRVNIKSIPRARLVKAGSGETGSSEYLVQDLREHEINDILFMDYTRDRFINELVRAEFRYYRDHGTTKRQQSAVLNLLEERAKGNVRGISFQTTNP